MHKHTHTHSSTKIPENGWYDVRHSNVKYTPTSLRPAFEQTLVRNADPRLYHMQTAFIFLLYFLLYLIWTRRRVRITQQFAASILCNLYDERGQCAIKLIVKCEMNPAAIRINSFRLCRWCYLQQMQQKQILNYLAGAFASVAPWHSSHICSNVHMCELH